MDQKKTYFTASEEETLTMASILAHYAKAGQVLSLDGDLGVGKTVFARGFIQALNHHDLFVPSPTFTLLNVYEEGKIPIYHFDFYRLNDPEELTFIGADEYLESEQGITLIEWAKRAPDWIPEDHLKITMDMIDDGAGRSFQFAAYGHRSGALLNDFRKQY
ncbi:tRNA (adenosine(37)-N6)-threonylcarbamoyltransferase complex ATPase subunit type 1 TsaE [Magnetococcales bacterium HHB-1]